MPDKLQDQLMKGQHTIHHKPGIFNDIWSDMAIETAYMRYGLTMRPEALKTWVMSIHAINTVLSDLNTINDNELHSRSYHEE